MLPSEEIKEKINLADLVGEYVSLKKAGTNYRGLCPFHSEKTASFMVSPAKQIWHCFGCGLGGDVFEFIKQIEAVEFPEALRILAQRAGVVLRAPTVTHQKEQDQKKVLYEINDLAARFYAQILARSSVAATAREYLRQRGLKPETIAAWQLGYSPDDFHTFENFIIKKGFQKKEAHAAGLLVQKEDGNFFDRFHGRVMFPLFDAHGRVVGFTGRLIVESQGAGKYINSPETLIYNKSQLIYGLHLAKNEIRLKDQAVVVEGQVDVITPHQAGFKNVVASSGTALTTFQLETLKRFTKNIAFAFDVDEAGLQATRRGVELALHAGFNVKIIKISKTVAKDPDELVRKDPTLWTAAVVNAQNFLDFYFESIFAKMSEELTSQDKKQAVAEILPLLSLLPESIDRAHYVQKLANKIGVDERLVMDLLNTYLAKKNPSTIKSSGSVVLRAKITRQEVLERRILGLLLKFSPDLQNEWKNFEAEDFSTPILKDIFTELTARGGEKALDQRYKSDTELLIFAIENELSFLEDWKLEDLKKSFFGEFKLEVLKRKLRELASRIKIAEQIGKLQEAKILTVEFNNLSKDLAGYAL
ncbi:MAG: DNA primase [bacterium]|nr:DNA primase [bacterium]